MSEAKGYALRVGSQILVPPNATEADKDAAWEMMTLEERKRTAKEMVRILKRGVWRMKHPKLAAFFADVVECGYAMIRSRGL